MRNVRKTRRELMALLSRRSKLIGAITRCEILHCRYVAVAPFEDGVQLQSVTRSRRQVPQSERRRVLGEDEGANARRWLRQGVKLQKTSTNAALMQKKKEDRNSL